MKLKKAGDDDWLIDYAIVEAPALSIIISSQWRYGKYTEDSKLLLS
jgi:hypothetical protein